MRQLVSLQQLIEEAEDQGEDSDTLYVDPDDVCTVDGSEEEVQEED